MFIIFFAFAEVIAIGLVVMMGVWFGKFQGGFAWREDPAVEFNYHPLFMTIGMILLYGNGMLLYRFLPGTNKFLVKCLHASFFIGTIVFSVVGLIAAFDSHNLVDPPIENLYSLHSWIGISVVGLFCLQWLLGFITFLLPCMPVFIRASLLPMHQFFGCALLGLACGAIVTGITERAIFKKDSIGYTDKTPEAILINCIGMLACIFAVLVIYMITRPQYARVEQGQTQEGEGNSTEAKDYGSVTNM